MIGWLVFEIRMSIGRSLTLTSVQLPEDFDQFLADKTRDFTMTFHDDVQRDAF